MRAGSFLFLCSWLLLIPWNSHGATLFLTQETLDGKFPGQGPARGILFNCDPYCRFVSLNEGEEWNPKLPTEPVEDGGLKIIRPSDPEYPLLLRKFPVLPYVKQPDPKPAPVDPRLTAFERERLKEGDFLLLDARLGLQAERLEVKSDSTILQNTASKSFLGGFRFELNVRPLKVLTMAGQNLRGGLFLRAANPARGPSGLEGSDLGISEMTYGTEWRVLTGTYQWIGVLSMDQTKYTISQEEVSAYSVDMKSGLLELGLGEPTWNALIGVSLFSNVSEKLGYRKSPFNRNVLQARGERCTTEMKRFGLQFALCAHALWQMDRQTAGINRNLITGLDGSSLTFQKMSVGFSIKGGDNLWQ
ncbi:MAG: hypothetical protein KF802_15095 [Bdellovibrionaceae bacterium]|nr:hypothetical protein [Pseudobdellovibrionaceae bacterium]MBX3033412.1 hypothetical protein [Pseudobdellovibrionaceae bacterium]